MTLFAATVDAGYTWLAVLAVANTVVSVAYYVRVLAPAYFAPAPSVPAQGAPASDVPLPTLGRWAAVAVALGAAGVVWLGILGNPLLAAFGAAHALPR